MIKVGVIVDWKKCRRWSGWKPLIESLSNGGELKVEEFPLAELILIPKAGGAGNGLDALGEQNVLILNWDVVNGDPDFGGHLAQMWIRHHRPELLLWVEDGNVLIIESQTRFGAPNQAAYDAMLGEGELLVSDLEDSARTWRVDKLHGNTCNHSTRFPKVKGFQNVRHPIEVIDRSKEKPFPATAWGPLIAKTREVTHYPLYTGWFRRKAPWRGHLGWVTLATTANRGWLRDHATFKVATYGDGAIFVSTMMIATTGQTALVKAMLNCAKKQVDHLPKPNTIPDKLKVAIRSIIPAFGGLVALQVMGHDIVAASLAEDSGTHIVLEGAIRLLYLSLAALLVELAFRGVQRAWRFQRQVLGYF